jgi:hypothetical protein
MTAIATTTIHATALTLATALPLPLPLPLATAAIVTATTTATAPATTTTTANATATATHQSYRLGCHRYCRHHCRDHDYVVVTITVAAAAIIVVVVTVVIVVIIVVVIITIHRRFRTVQNPLVCAVAQEKAGSCNTHPDVLAQVKATDDGNKRKISEKKEVDILSIKQKRQRDKGWFKAIKYFDNVREEKLTWAENIFDDV